MVEQTNKKKVWSLFLPAAFNCVLLQNSVYPLISRQKLTSTKVPTVVTFKRTLSNCSKVFVIEKEAELLSDDLGRIWKEH